MTLLGPLYKQVKEHPNRTAVIDGDCFYTYLELWSCVMCATDQFRVAGLQRKDRVAVWLRNGIGCLIMHLGAIEAGLIPVLLKEDIGPVELDHALEDSGASLIVANAALMDRLPGTFRLPRQVWAEGRIPLRAAVSYRAPETQRSFETASIHYSYLPTDGRAHGAMLTHQNYIHAALGYARFHGISCTDRTLVLLPMATVFILAGALLSNLYAGATVVIGGLPRPRSIADLTLQHSVTRILVIPQLLQMISHSAPSTASAFASVHSIVSGGDFLSADEQIRAQETLNVPVLQGYGLTECFPVLCNPCGSGNVPGTLGIVGTSYIKCRVVDADGTQAHIDCPGEIEIGGPTVMAGYFGSEAATRRVIRNGWLRTGDFGWIDARGYVFFAGQKKPLINRSGNKVDPLEVARVIEQYPGVSSVTVFAESVATKQQQLVAEVRTALGVVIAPEQIRKFCKRYLASYKVPNRVQFTAC